jgi:hypothetical protein
MGMPPRTPEELKKYMEHLEGVLRKEHAKDPALTFQDFVDWKRNSHGPFREVAITYNNLVYKMQQSWNSGKS